MERDRVACSRGGRASALPLGLANDFEVRDGNQTASVRYQGVACFIPIVVVFSADDMEKVAFGEAQFLCIAGVWIIIVQRFDDLLSDAMSVEPASVAMSLEICSPASVVRWRWRTWE